MRKPTYLSSGKSRERIVIYMKYDVVIIGAGPGGIFSAYELMKQNKNLKIADVRSILKERKHSPKSIKIDLQDDRNRGYGFVEFNSPQEANAFIEDFENLKLKIGENSYVEFSQEKNLNNRHNKK